MIAKLRVSVGEFLRRQPAQRQQALRRNLLVMTNVLLRVLGWVRAPIEWLAVVAGTDKALGHRYMQAYRRFFAEYRGRSVRLLEIGVGGYDRLDGGHSLRLWEAYFQRGTIIGIDLYDKTFLTRGRVHVHQCSQVDRQGLLQLAERYGGAFDLIIDDGSHYNTHQIETFQILFPLLSSPGVYVVEDTQTSYWPAYGGGSLGSAGYASSAMAFFKRLVDGVNHAEFLPVQKVPPLPFQSQIRGIYFEHNMIVILKADNSEASNVDLRGRWRELAIPNAVDQAGLLE